MRDWTHQQVARLLQLRPDLLGAQRPVDLADLAQRAQHHRCVVSAIRATTLPENRLLQMVVCCRPDAPLDEFAASLPDGVTLDDVETTLVRLEEMALVWRHGQRLHSSGTLRQAMPTTLGPPVHLLLKDQPVDYLKHAIGKLRAAASVRAGLLPSSTVALKGRQGRKADLIDELESLLATPGVVDSALEEAPDEALDLARSLAEGSPAVGLPFHLSHSRYHQPYYVDQDVYWLFERALLLPDRGGDAALQPREVGVALRGGRPVDDLALDEPILATGAIATDEVDSAAAHQAITTLDRLADLLERWSASPAKELKSGGLGVNAVKQVAGALEVTSDEAACLVELLHLAGLVESRTVSRKERRQVVYESFAAPSAAAAAWLETSPATRWRQLAHAWLRAEHWPSASGRKGPGGEKAAPVLSWQLGDEAPERRGEVLAALAQLGLVAEGNGDTPAAGLAERTTPDALASTVYWRRPQPWLALPAGDPATMIHWVYEEAELLGIVAHGRLASCGQTLLDGSDADAEAIFAEAAPSEGMTFTLQADMTAVVVERLDRDVLIELRLLADVESTGGATTFRFSDATLRRAVDAGRDADSILAFLHKHAEKGIPQPLEYLVADVARRHGHLTVGTAQSFVTAEDPAVLADACSHRRARKLGLRRLASTVAVSTQPPDNVIETLRVAGFFPTRSDGDDPASPTPDAGNVIALADRREGSEQSADRLPEPFRARRSTVPATTVRHLTVDETQTLAEDIVHARPTAPSFGDVDVSFGHHAPAHEDEIDPDLAADDLDALFGPPVEASALPDLCRRAADNGEVMAFMLVDDSDVDPVVLIVAGATSTEVSGVDMAGGRTRTIAYDQIAATIELGPLDGLGELVDELDGLLHDELDDTWEPARAGPARRPPSGRRRRGRRR